MYGLEAIAHYNGWAMAVTGAAIVMAGLVSLCIIISQFQRVSALFEKPRAETAPETVEEAPSPISALERCPADIDAVAGTYRELTDSLGHEFYLSELYQFCQENNLPHPHLTIKCLREAGRLVSLGEGQFTWNN